MLYDLNSYIVFVGLQWKSGRGRRSSLNRIFMHTVSCSLRHLVLSSWDPCAVDVLYRKHQYLHHVMYFQYAVPAKPGFVHIVS